VLVTAANVEDRDGARPLLQRLAESCHRIRLVWADGGYAGKLLDWARDTLNIPVQVVKRSEDTTGFVVLPRRWVVERSLAWITRNRRCARDYEALPTDHEAMVRWAMIRITSRRLTCQRPVFSPRGRPVVFPGGGHLDFPDGGQLFLPGRWVG
jgi:transposase